MTESIAPQSPTFLGAGKITTEVNGNTAPLFPRAQAGLRGRNMTFIVDPQNVIRFVYVTDLSVGRNPQEVLRVLDALQTDELCPCNWKKGDETIDLKEATSHKPGKKAA